MLARRYLHELHYSLTLIESQHLCLRELEPARGWGSYFVNLKKPHGLLLEVPAPMEEWSVMESALQLYQQLGGGAMAIAGGGRYASKNGSSDVLDNASTPFEVFHRVFARQNVLQARGYTDEVLPRLPSAAVENALYVKAELPRSLSLKALQGIIGEFRIVGLFTSTAYTRPARTIPYLRRKLDAVIRRAAFPSEGHSEKALLNILETFPRDELFQIDEDELYRFTLAILYLGERPRVRVLPRYDRFDRFVSVLVYVPRGRYDSAVQVAIGKHLTEVFAGRITVVQPYYLEGPLVRAHFIIARRAEAAHRVAPTALEAAVETIIRSWSDGFVDELNRAYDPARARDLARRYGEAFSAAYREAYTPEVAVRDLRVFESVSADRPLAVNRTTVLGNFPAKPRVSDTRPAASSLARCCDKFPFASPVSDCRYMKSACRQASSAVRMARRAGSCINRSRFVRSSNGDVTRGPPSCRAASS